MQLTAFDEPKMKPKPLATLQESAPAFTACACTGAAYIRPPARRPIAPNATASFLGIPSISCLFKFRWSRRQTRTSGDIDWFPCLVPRFLSLAFRLPAAARPAFTDRRGRGGPPQIGDNRWRNRTSGGAER